MKTGKARVVCLIFGVVHINVAPANCLEQTVQPHKNREYCQKSKCPSAHRICPVCLEQGAHAHKRNKCSSVDPKTGLCKFHKKNGKDAIRTEHDIKIKGAKSKSNVSDIAAIDKLLTDYANRHGGHTGLILPNIAGGDKKGKKKSIVQGKFSDVMEIPIEQISPDPHQPRKIFEQAEIDELAASIKKNGQKTPVWLIKVGEKKYLLNGGERRWRACLLAKSATMKSLILTGIEEQRDRHFSSTLENLHRKDFLEIEAALAIKRIMLDFDMSIKETAEQMGMDYQKVLRLHRLLDLDISIIQKMEPFLPKKEALSLKIAQKLSSLTKPSQTTFLEKIEDIGKKEGKKMSAVRACLLIDRLSSIAGEKTRIKSRGPADDFKMINNGLARMEDILSACNDLGIAGARRVFENRPLGEIKKTTRRLEEIRSKIDKFLGWIPNK